jgi:hypothetical protein
MRTANDPFDEIDSKAEVRSRLAVHVLLIGGAGLLAFLTWLLTL